MPSTAPADLTRHDVLVTATTDPRLWAAARDVVVRTSQATGYPDPNRWPAGALAARTAARQEAAQSVWVALDPSGTVVGHALLTRGCSSSPAMAVPDLADACASGRVLELGGLAVDPAWHGRGIARRLRDERLVHAHRSAPGFDVVTVTRPGGPSDLWYARHWDLLGATCGLLEPSVNVYRQPAHP